MLLSWTRLGATSGYIEAAYRPAQHGWQRPIRVSPTDIDAAAAEVAVGGGDRAVATWRGYDKDDAAHLQLCKLHP